MTGRSGGVECGEVPRAVRCWFVIHSAIDWMFAIPLFAFPDAFLRALGWTVVDPMAARGVAARLGKKRLRERAQAEQPTRRARRRACAGG